MSALGSAHGVYLQAYLRPLQPWLERADVTDIMVNRPGEIWVESLGRPAERRQVPELSEQVLGRLAAQIAAANHQAINREHPILSATLPDGARVQIVGAPATRGPLVLAIRRQVVQNLRLADYTQAGAFDGAAMTPFEQTAELDRALAELIANGRREDFLRLAVRARKNIVISGGTATGKTTFANALIKEIPLQERLVVIEDTPELQIDHPNAVGLIAARSVLGEAAVSVEDLLQASLRLRPDRIILGELRGGEAYSFLRAINSGHPGSITTVHADSPAAALQQIALMVLGGGVNLGRAEIVAYVASLVDVAVQLRRVDGKRQVSKISFRPGVVEGQERARCAA